MLFFIRFIGRLYNFKHQNCEWRCKIWKFGTCSLMLLRVIRAGFVCYLSMKELYLAFSFPGYGVVV
ncbi:hypothetical protein F2Q70_00023601 [Brassica cretica]|uniref:Uncharacterized protein n=1 Tax=Brassica cretica TaxID=69181 RepID=A0A8S9GTP5_BRACR|nr:hypothetical protein F2Q70_00023601 [Brassica cretica]